MKRKHAVLCVLCVLALVVFSEIMISFKLDISLFTRQNGVANYVNSANLEDVTSGGLKYMKGPNLRPSTYSERQSQSTNANPFYGDYDIFVRAGISVSNVPMSYNLPYHNPFLSKELEITVPSSETLSIGGVTTALVIFTFDRPTYLLKTINSIVSVLSSPLNQYAVDIILSEDGKISQKKTVDSIEALIKRTIPKCTFQHMFHKQTKIEGDTGYHFISKHIKSTLDILFLQSRYDQVIILDDDMLIAPDFFEYMSAMSSILRQDPSIACISAWSDNGQRDYILDSTLILRSDTFPGMGWMVTSTEWTKLSEIWPEAYFMTWMTSTMQHDGRVCLRPEVSRSFTFGDVGISQKMLFNERAMHEVVLNSKFVQFSKMDLSYLIKTSYDKKWIQLIDESEVIDSPLDIVSVSTNSNAKVMYSLTPGDSSFCNIASALGIMGDFSSGTARTAYNGVITVGYKGVRLFIVPDRHTSVVNTIACG